jgi:subtilisin family serine protease
MTRSRRFGLLTLMVATAVTLVTAQGAPQPGGTFAGAARLRDLPADTFSRQAIGVRGMQATDAARLDPRLRSLVDAARGGSDVRARSVELGATATDARLPVEINAPSPDRVDAVRTQVQAAGGEVMSSYDATVWATLPVAGIDRLATSPDVFYLTVQERMELLQTTPGDVAASLRASRVQDLHGAGIRGRGVKIGIIDPGFAGYTKLQRAGRVPAPKAMKGFPDGYVVENDEPHGAACAEIIHAMAPEAELYIAGIMPTNGATIAAANWLISQGVDIISYSMGNAVDPGDGSGSLARFVDEVVTQRGVLWVVASGNYGEKHWSTVNRDADRNELIDIPKGSDPDGLGLISLRDEFSIVVRWNDAGPDPRQPSSSQDIDAFLFLADGPKLELIARGDHPQSGPGRAFEVLKVKRAGIRERVLRLALVNRRVNREVLVHVFVDGPAVLEMSTPVGSVASPASAQHALAVGAWDAKTSDLASYSSQGPTDDNRLKPEIAAPAGLQSAAYGSVFDGTSAACPHAAGFAALLKQADPSLKGATLRRAVMQAVEPKGTPVPNSASGYGWIDGRRVRGGAAPAGPAPVAPSPVAPPPVAAAPSPAPPAASGGIAVPAAWGGRVDRSVLDRLTASNTPPVFLTRVVTGRDLYRIGDGLKVGFSSSQTCEYLLFHRSVTGEYTLLAPRNNIPGRVTAGTSVVLPDGTETFQVTEPIGSEDLLLLCSKSAINLARLAPGAVPRELVVTRHRYEVTR